MRLTFFTNSVCLAALFICLPAAIPRGLNPIPPAVAEANVSISFGTFYDDLDPYGDWVSYRGGYVFVPVDVQDTWRPYTEGHWVYTDRYGWMWVTDEPFGWATYHYGRWGYAEEIGWHWVPGHRWAPAWVSWRKGADYVVWAPLPPEYDSSEEDGNWDGDVPEYYWVGVPAENFLDADLSIVIQEHDDDRGVFLAETEALGAVRLRDDIVVNTILDVDFVEKETQKEVKRVKLQDTDDPQKSGRSDGDAVSVYTGDAKSDPDAKPAKIEDVEQVKEVQEKRKGKPTDASQKATDEPAGGEAADTGQGDKTKKRAKQGDDAEAQPAESGSQTNKKKKLQADQPDQATGTNESENQGQKDSATQSDDSANQAKKKKKNSTIDSDDSASQSDDSTNQGKKKKKQSTSDADDSASQSDESASQGKKKKKQSTIDADDSASESDESADQGKKKKKQSIDEPANDSDEPSQAITKKQPQDATEQQDQQGGDVSGKNKKKSGECDPSTGAQCGD